jgi:hypothetical protein
MASKQEGQAIHERIVKGWTLYPAPPFDRSFYGDVPTTELKWPTSLGWMTLSEYNRRGGHLQPFKIVTAGTVFSPPQDGE